MVDFRRLTAVVSPYISGGSQRPPADLTRTRTDTPTPPTADPSPMMQGDRQSHHAPKRTRRRRLGHLGRDEPQKATAADLEADTMAEGERANTNKPNNHPGTETKKTPADPKKEPQNVFTFQYIMCKQRYI